MAMKKVYVFGNEYLKEDKLAVEVAARIKGARAVKCTSPDDLLPDLLDRNVKEICILDVVKGIARPVLITDVSKLKINRIISLHDFDVGYFLNLAKKVGLGKSIKIIGLPAKGDAGKLAIEVEKWL